MHSLTDQGQGPNEIHFKKDHLKNQRPVSRRRYREPGQPDNVTSLPLVVSLSLTSSKLLYLVAERIRLEMSPRARKQFSDRECASQILEAALIDHFTDLCSLPIAEVTAPDRFPTWKKRRYTRADYYLGFSGGPEQPEAEGMQ